MKISFLIFANEMKATRIFDSIPKESDILFVYKHIFSISRDNAYFIVISISELISSTYHVVEVSALLPNCNLQQVASFQWVSRSFFKNDIKPNFWNFILHIPDVLKSLPRKIFLSNPEIFKSKVKMKKSRI